MIDRTGRHPTTAPTGFTFGRITALCRTPTIEHRPSNTGNSPIKSIFFPKKKEGKPRRAKKCSSLVASLGMARHSHIPRSTRIFLPGSGRDEEFFFLWKSPSPTGGGFAYAFFAPVNASSFLKFFTRAKKTRSHLRPWFRLGFSCGVDAYDGKSAQQSRRGPSRAKTSHPYVQAPCSA